MKLFFAALLAAVVVGQQAPDFTLSDQNNKATSLASAHGHKAVVVFYRGYW